MVINSLAEKIKIIENKLFNVGSDSEIIEAQENSFKCKECDFVGKNEKGLNIHMKKSHGPSFNCDLCNKSFKSERLLKIHNKEHSYDSKLRGSKLENHTCKKCDFTSKNLETMEVHVGKCSESFECGLCDEKFDKLDDLETHLNTCEVYECALVECLIRLKTLSEMKNHIAEEHEDGIAMHHLKMDRTDTSKVSFKYHLLSDL